MSIFVKFEIIFSRFKNVPVKYIATYCPWYSHQIHSSCISMSLWWQNNPSLWLSWTVSIPTWVSILWHAACAPSDAKLLEGGVNWSLHQKCWSTTHIVEWFQTYLRIWLCRDRCFHWIWSSRDVGDVVIMASRCVCNGTLRFVIFIVIWSGYGQYQNNFVALQNGSRTTLILLKVV